jgi:hypothetical protein
MEFEVHDRAEVCATVAARVYEEETTCARWPTRLPTTWRAVAEA